MRRLPVLLLLTLSVGCAQIPSLTLRVESAHTARLAPEVLRQLEDSSASSLREIDRDLERGRQRVANARKALGDAKAESVLPEVAEVHAAKVLHADWELKWEEALLRAAEWRRGSRSSAAELAKAETLSRTGDDIDVTAYAHQYQRMRSGLAAALRQQTTMRSQFDDSERRLAGAKARYAQARGGEVVAATSPSPQ